MSEAQKKEREKVVSKDEFATQLQADLVEHEGIKLSKTKTWEVFKTVQNSVYTQAAKRSVSLAGVGRFYTLASGRSGGKNKKMKFRASDRVNNALTAGKPFFGEDKSPEDPLK